METRGYNTPKTIVLFLDLFFKHNVLSRSSQDNFLSMFTNIIDSCALSSSLFFLKFLFCFLKTVQSSLIIPRA